MSYRLQQPLEVREVGGAGASIVSFTLHIFRGTKEETEVLGPEAILAQITTLRIDARSSRSIALAIDFNTFPADRMTGELRYLGDDGITRPASVELHPQMTAALR
jgi:hypothetical protein